MKNRVIGILIFLFFIAMPFLLEGGNILGLVRQPSPFIMVFGPAIGLTVAHYRKGMDKQTVLKKAKKYLIVSGLLGTLLSFISVLGTTDPETMTNAIIFSRYATCLISAFLGLLAAYIVDTFIDDK